MTTTNTHTRNSCLACSSTFPSASPAPQRPGSDRIGSEFRAPSRPPPAPTSSPWCAFATPGMLSRPPVPALCRGRWVQKTGLWVLNWIWRARRKRQTSHPPVSHAEFFLFLFFFKRRRPPNTAFPTLLFRLKCQKLLDWGRRRNGTVALDPFTFLGVFSRRISWNMYHVCSSLSLLFVVTDSCRCQILSEGSEVLEIWMCFYFWFIFFNVFATLSPRWVCWFYLPCLVSICVSPPPTYRTIFLKSLISVFIHTFFFLFFG